MGGLVQFAGTIEACFLPRKGRSLVKTDGAHPYPLKSERASSKLEHLALDVRSTFSFVVVWTIPFTSLHSEAWVHPGVSFHQEAVWMRHTTFSYLPLLPSSNPNPEDLVLSHATQNIHATLQGMWILSTSHLLKSYSWGSSLAVWPMDPVLMTSVVNTMSTNVWGAVWSQPGSHRDSSPPLSMQEESPGGEGLPDAPEEMSGYCTIHRPYW